ncbi:MAG: c-type cytochrome [Sandaracinus sp.]
MLRASFPFLSVLALGGALLGACGNGGGGTPMSDANTAAVAAGARIAQLNVCTSCHGADYAGTSVAMGGSYPENITQDPDHGIGDWTDAQIAAAVTSGTGIGGRTLCPSMPRIPLSATDAANLVAFLRTIPGSTNDAPAGTCTAP